MPEGQKGSHSSTPGLAARVVPPLVLGVFTLVTRVFFHGALYFSDGPQHVRSILEESYMIQPPGYWLFNRIAGMVVDPLLGISDINILCSVAGVLVFYFTALFFAPRKNAFIAALAYSCIFYLWFSGEIHSTYATQALFPVAMFHAFLRYDKSKASWRLLSAATFFAVGAGLRPSDGAFLLPMVLYYCATRLSRRKAAIFLSLVSLLCLVWIIPTFTAYRQTPEGIHGAFAYMRNIATQKSIVSGLTSAWLANVTRFVLPLLVAFWLVLPAAMLTVKMRNQDWRIRMLVLWIVPGSVFLALSLAAAAPCLNFLAAAVLLLAIGAPRLMFATALWNAAFFLGFSPLPSRYLAINAWNCYAGQFTRYGIEHQWQPSLSAIQGTNTIVPAHSKSKH
jgi:4-amino-4-deoxy-L-arabinose transferase-like glycosyltransferase